MCIVCSLSRQARAHDLRLPAGSGVDIVAHVMSTEAVGSMPKAFVVFLHAEMRKWSKASRDAGVKPKQGKIQQPTINSVTQSQVRSSWAIRALITWNFCATMPSINSLQHILRGAHE